MNEKPALLRIELTKGYSRYDKERRWLTYHAILRRDGMIVGFGSSCSDRSMAVFNLLVRYKGRPIRYAS